MQDHIQWNSCITAVYMKTHRKTHPCMHSDKFIASLCAVYVQWTHMFNKTLAHRKLQMHTDTFIVAFTAFFNLNTFS